MPLQPLLKNPLIKIKNEVIGFLHFNYVKFIVFPDIQEWESVIFRLVIGIKLHAKSKEACIVREAARIYSMNFCFLMLISLLLLPLSLKSLQIF